MSLLKKSVIVVTVVSVLLVASCVWIVRASMEPPKEEKVISSFNTHRETFEKLRNMLASDPDVEEVATWGISPKDRDFEWKQPPAAGISVGRYGDYLALMKEIGVPRISHSHDGDEFYFAVWGSGFAGDTRHVTIVWRDRAPANITPSLDAFYRTPKPRTPVYRHIEGNWYVWADW